MPTPRPKTTELLKQALAHEAHELAAFSLMDRLELLARNPVADRGIKGVLLCNPGPHPIIVRPDLPASWFDPPERTYRANRMFYDGRPWGERFPGAASRHFGPVQLPPFSWKTLPLASLPAPEGASEVTHEVAVKTIERREVNFAPIANFRRRVGTIESPFHALRYDPDTGRILSLFDKERRRETLGSGDTFDFFAFVRERTNALVEASRYAFYQRDLEREKMDTSCWQDWWPVRECATRVARCSVAVSPGRATLVRELEAPGMIHIVQRIALSGHDSVIELDADFEMIPDPSPQAIYFAFPQNLSPGWKAAFDTAGAIVRVDDDQLPGACRNWVNSEMFAAMWDDRHGVALLTPEAPAVQFGGFHFGRPLDSLPRPANPLLLAWPSNNYWDTNTPRVQAGRIHLRYGYVTFGQIDLPALRKKAETFRQPQLIWPVTTGGRDKDEGRLF